MSQYSIPLMEYLSLTGQATKKPLTALQNQQVADGAVIFDNDWDEKRLKALLEHVNTGGPMADEIGPAGEAKHNPVVVGDDDWGGIDLRDFTDLLHGFHIDGVWGNASCPVHGGPGHSLTSFSIHMPDGKYGCKAGCDNPSIYAAVMDLAKGAGRIEKAAEPEVTA